MIVCCKTKIKTITATNERREKCCRVLMRMWNKKKQTTWSLKKAEGWVRIGWFYFWLFERLARILYVDHMHRVYWSKTNAILHFFFLLQFKNFPRHDNYLWVNFRNFNEWGHDDSWSLSLYFRSSFSSQELQPHSSFQHHGGQAIHRPNGG